MPHLLVSRKNIENNYFVLDGEAAHHLLRVLRKQPGDEIQLTDGQGTFYEAKVLFADPSIPEAKGVILSTQQPPTSHYTLQLFQGLPKGSKFDYVLEKATELGVHRITPFLSEKSLIKLDDKQNVAKQKRWTKIVEAASQQCNRAVLPQVDLAIPLMKMGPQLKDGLSLLPDPAEKKSTLKEVLQGKMPTPEIKIVVGPESGFSEKERTFLKNQGCVAFSLGERILRTETAGLTLLSILNYELELF